MPPPTNQTLSHVRQSMAYREEAYFRSHGHPTFNAFTGIPTAAERASLVFPYSYRLWAGTTYGPLPGQPEAQRRRAPSDGGASPRSRLHTVWVMLLIGERSDPLGLADLDATLAEWVDLYDDFLRANIQLPDSGGAASCQRAQVLRSKPLQDTLLGEQHFGLLFTVEVWANPLVRSAALG